MLWGKLIDPNLGNNEYDGNAQDPINLIKNHASGRIKILRAGIDAVPMSKQAIITVRGANQLISFGTNGVARIVATAAKEINQPRVKPEAVMRSKC